MCSWTRTIISLCIIFSTKAVEYFNNIDQFQCIEKIFKRVKTLTNRQTFFYKVLKRVKGNELYRNLWNFSLHSTHKCMLWKFWKCGMRLKHFNLFIICYTLKKQDWKITKLLKVSFAKMNELKLCQVELFSFFQFMFASANASELFCMAYLADIERFLYHSNFSF